MFKCLIIDAWYNITHLRIYFIYIIQLKHMWETANFGAEQQKMEGKT